MRRAKLVALMTFVLTISLVAFSSAEGQTKKGGGDKGGAALGKKVFDDQCTACHDGGGNSIEGDKTLKMADLKREGMDNVAAIKKRVEDGKGIMPEFKAQLKPAEIEAVANYVLAQAQKDWK
jgi:cytochrome c6